MLKASLHRILRHLRFIKREDYKSKSIILQALLDKAKEDNETLTKTVVSYTQEIICLKSQMDDYKRRTDLVKEIAESITRKYSGNPDHTVRRAAENIIKIVS